MITACEHRAEPCAVRTLPPPAPQIQQPGVVDVGTVQSTGLSFADALLMFRSAHVGRGLQEPHRTRYEQALQKDMRAESHNAPVPAVAPRPSRYRQVPVGMVNFDECERFFEWALANRENLSVPLIRQTWRVSRATAYRRLACFRELQARS